MTSVRSTFLTLTLFLLTVSGVAYAHHGGEAYDMGKTVTLKGVISNFEWNNPHSQVHLDVTDEKGNVVHWNFETQPPSILTHAGWTRNSLKPGDQVTLVAHPVKNGAPVGILVSVTVPSGEELTPREK
jgi:hypothetical protein